MRKFNDVFFPCPVPSKGISTLDNGQGGPRPGDVGPPWQQAQYASAVPEHHGVTKEKRKKKKKERIILQGPSQKAPSSNPVRRRSATDGRCTVVVRPPSPCPLQPGLQIAHLFQARLCVLLLTFPFINNNQLSSITNYTFQTKTHSIPNDSSWVTAAALPLALATAALAAPAPTAPYVFLPRLLISHDALWLTTLLTAQINSSVAES